MTRDLGFIGESAFIDWCAVEGFHAQKSQSDRYGWDFLLEREPDKTDQRPLDAQNALPKFLVQVKATERPNEPPRIKLSALKHLVDADLPAAVAVLFFDKDGRRPHRRLLAPVNEKVMYEALKRVRKEEARGNRAIHKITVPVDLTDALTIGESGEGIAQALSTFFGADPSDYVRRKSIYRQTCGHDAYPMIGGFFVPGEDAGQKIGDLFLGSTRELAISDLSIEPRRFGIALPNDRQFFRDAIIEMDAVPLMGAFIELEAKTGSWATVSVDVFALPPPLREIDDSRIRLANSTFEVVLDFDRGWAGITFDYNGKREVDIEEAISVIEIGAILAHAEKTITVALGDVKLPLVSTGDPGPFSNWIPLAPVLRRFLKAIGRARLEPRTLLKLADFYEWLDEHAPLIAIASTAGVNMMFPRWPEDHIVDDQRAILVPLSLTLAGLLYTALVEVPILSASRDEKEVKIVGGEPRMVAEIVRQSGADTSDFIDMAVEAFRRETKLEGPALIAGGLVYS